MKVRSIQMAAAPWRVPSNNHSVADVRRACDRALKSRGLDSSADLLWLWRKAK